MSLTKDQLIREYQNRKGTLPALLMVYGMIVGTMVLTGISMV